jgi:hypothetical protein
LNVEESNNCLTQKVKYLCFREDGRTDDETCMPFCGDGLCVSVTGATESCSNCICGKNLTAVAICEESNDNLKLNTFYWNNYKTFLLNE